MATVERASLLLGEVARFLAAGPSPKEILAFRPSDAVKERFRDLLTKNGKGTLTREEEYELNQYEQLDMLMQNTKARIRVLQKQAK